MFGSKRNVPKTIKYILNSGFYWTLPSLVFAIRPILSNILLIELEYVAVLTLLGEKWLSSRIWAKANYPPGGIDPF